MNVVALFAAVALLFGAGWLTGRKHGQVMGRLKALDQVRRLGARGRHPAERGMATLDVVLWAVVGAWSLILLAAHFGGN